MRLPIIERIALDLMQALQQVRRPAWNSTLIVERAKGSGNPPADSLVVMSQADPHGLEADQMHVAWKQPFLLLCYVVESAEYDLPLDARINIVLADVMKACRADQQRGGLAFNTVFPDHPLELLPVQPVSGFTLQVDVDYQTLINDPYSQ